MWIQNKLKTNKLSRLSLLLYAVILTLLIDFAPDQHLDTVAFILHIASHIHSLSLIQNHALLKSILTFVPLIHYSMLSLSPQGLIYDAIIFAVVVYICSIQKILKDIIDREIYARVSSIPNLSSFKSHREIIKAFENLP